MRARKKYVGPTHPADWTIETEIRINGRVVDVNTELTVEGESGRFLFRRQVTNGEGKVWIDAIQVNKKHELTRSFRPERVRTVHRIARTRKGVAACTR